MKKKLMVFIIVLLMLLQSTSAYAQVKKDETVYVILNNDGSVSNINVVNHIFGYDDTNTYTDYGNYIEMKNLVDDTKPEVTGDEIKWPMSMLKEKDIYYQGTTNKELPVKLSIKYFLDGKEIDSRELAGKSGHIKIDLNIKYDMFRAADLMGQIQFTLDLDKFKNIKSSGNKVVIGKKENITFTSMAVEEESFSIEMDGRNIELDPITISIVPKNFSIPSDIKKSIDSLTGGLREMEDGAIKLQNGSAEAADGTYKLMEGIEKLNGGVAAVYSGTNEISKKSKMISSGMEEFQRGLSLLAGHVKDDKGREMIFGLNSLYKGISELSQKSNVIYKGMEGLNGSTIKINNGMDNLKNGVGQLQSGHEELVKLAKSLQESSDPRVKALVEGIIAEKKAIDDIKGGIDESTKGLKYMGENINQLYDGYGKFDKGLYDMNVNMKLFVDNTSNLPEALEEMNQKFGGLKNGANAIFNGFNEINNSLLAIKINTEGLPQSAAKLAKGQNEIKEGIYNLNKNGIKKMRSSLDENLNNNILNTKNKYISFANNEKNKNSTVQFIMRTPAIKIPEEKKETTSIAVKGKSLLQRILDLFR